MGVMTHSLAELLREPTREDVGGAAGRNAYEKTDWLRGITARRLSCERERTREPCCSQYYAQPLPARGRSNTKDS